jgi:hypothetical protein
MATDPILENNAGVVMGEVLTDINDGIQTAAGAAGSVATVVDNNAALTDRAMAAESLLATIVSFLVKHWPAHWEDHTANK